MNQTFYCTNFRVEKVLIYFYGYVNYKRFGKLGFSSVVIRGQIRFWSSLFLLRDLAHALFLCLTLFASRNNYKIDFVKA